MKRAQSSRFLQVQLLFGFYLPSCLWLSGPAEELDLCALVWFGGKKEERGSTSDSCSLQHLSFSHQESVPGVAGEMQAPGWNGNNPIIMINYCFFHNLSLCHEPC